MNDRTLVLPSRTTSILIGGSAAGAGLVLWKTLPSLVAVYADRGLALPILTRLLLSVPLWAWPLAGLGLGALLYGKDRHLSADAAKQVNLLALVASAAVGAFVLLALLLPFLSTTG